MHPSDQRNPTLCVSPPQLVHAPELAVLGVLEVALDVSVSALFAEHPTLVELGELSEPASLQRARRVLASVHSLRRALQRYRTAVLAAMSAVRDEDDDDLPF